MNIPPFNPPITTGRVIGVGMRPDVSLAFDRSYWLFRQSGGNNYLEGEFDFSQNQSDGHTAGGRRALRHFPVRRESGQEGALLLRSKLKQELRQRVELPLRPGQLEYVGLGQHRSHVLAADEHRHSHR